MQLIFLIKLFQHAENMHRLINNHQRISSTVFENISIIAEAFIHLQRCNLNAAESLQTALSINIKAAHSVKLIVKPFDAYRCAGVNGVHVQNIAA